MRNETPLTKCIYRFMHKTHDGRPVLAVVLVVSVTIAFAFWIWPTPYREWAARGGKHSHGPMVYHRINRLTGEREYGFPGMFGMIKWSPEGSQTAARR